MPTKILPQDIGSGVDFTLSEISLSDGTAALPSLAFASDQDTGLRYIATNQLSIVTNGADKLIVRGSEIRPQVQMQHSLDGTASAPAYSFENNSNMGMYRIGANALGLAAGGGTPLRLNTNEVIVQSGNVLKIQNGSIGTPSLTFENDPDTGIYGLADNSIRFTLGATQRHIFDSSSLTIVNDAAQLNLTRSSNGRTPLIGIYDAFGGFRFHTPNSNAESTTVAYQLECDNPSANSILLKAIANGQFQYQDGSPSIPSVSFLTDTDTGIYTEGTADTLRFGTGGAQRFKIDNAGLYSLLAHQFSDGTAALPSISFSNDIDTGMYRFGTNNVGFAANGSNILRINTSGIEMTTGVIGNTNGSATAPSYSFVSEPGLGWYRGGAARMSLAAGTVEAAYFDVSTGVFGLKNNYNMETNVGSVTTPGYSFNGDSNTGIYRSGADEISFAAGGVQVGMLSTSRPLGRLIGHQETSGTTQASTNGTTHVASGHTITYTAKRTDSKLYFFISGMAQSTQNSANGAGVSISLVRDGSTTVYSNSRVQMTNVGSGSNLGGQVAVMFQTNPPDTSSHTYEVYFALPTGGYSGTATYGGDGTTAGNGRLVIWEVAAI